jgi:hypothetical protein
MKIYLLLITISFAIVITGCGKKAEEVKEAIELAQKAPEMANKMQSNMEAGKAKLEERKKKGDTLALNYKKLQEYLPASISGYEAEEPKGESVNAGGFSYSTAERRYKKSGSDDYVSIKLVDYNQFYEGYNALTAVWAQGITIENDQTLEKTFPTNISDVAGYERFEKKNKEAKVTYGVGFRFFLDIEANNQSNTDFVKKVAESMKLSELAGM